MIDTVREAIDKAGFQVERTQFALARNDNRMFATMDLSSAITPGVNLAIGIRNSQDKSFPMGFCAGNRVFCCDNMAFSAELMVHKKHTRFGRDRYIKGIYKAVGELDQFRQGEQQRIEWFQQADLSEDAANSYLLQAFDKQLVSHTNLRTVIHAYRNPSFDEFQPRTKWSLLNAFTEVLGPRFKKNPPAYAKVTMSLQDLLEGPRVIPSEQVEVHDAT